MSEHTPGPWTVGKALQGAGWAQIDAGSWMSLAQVAVLSEGEPHPVGEANARLIAAAPALYEALKEIADAPDVQRHVRDRARAALASASLGGRE